MSALPKLEIEFSQRTSVTDSLEHSKKPPDLEPLREIVSWLNKDYHSDNEFIDSQPIPTCDMRTALKLATKEIVHTYDPILKEKLWQARGPAYCLETKTEEFYVDRPVQWERMEGSDVDSWDRSGLKEYLDGAKNEIVWIKAQLVRLQLRMDVAKTLKGSSTQESFSYDVASRAWVDKESFVQRTSGGGLVVRNIH